MFSKSMFTFITLRKMKLSMNSTKFKIKFVPTLLFKKKVKCKTDELRNPHNMNK